LAVAQFTSTVCPDVVDKVIVIEAGVVASLPLELAALNCTVGDGSSSVIVTIARSLCPKVAPPVGFDKVRLIVSLGSFRLSFMIGIENVLPAVSPLAQLNVPLLEV
jgi:hypothetical protein